MLLAGAARTGIVAADFRAIPHYLPDRRDVVMIPMIAVRPVHVAVHVAVGMTVIMVTIRTMHMALRFP